MSVDIAIQNANGHVLLMDSMLLRRDRYSTSAMRVSSISVTFANWNTMSEGKLLFDHNQIIYCS